jgi:hypothetical protein
MSLQAVGTFVKTNAIRVSDGVVAGVVWVGRTIKGGWNNYLVPAVMGVWNFTRPLVANSFNFMKTGYGFGIIGLGFATVLELAADQYFPGDDNRSVRYSVHFIAAAIFVGVGVLAATYGSKSVI